MAKARYFSTGMKERVVSRLLDRKFNPLREQHDQELAEHAAEVIRVQLDGKEWDLAKSLPEGWLPLMSEVRFEVWDRSTSGYNTVRLHETVRVPSSLYGRTFGEKNLTPAMWERYCELKRRDKERQADRARVKRELEALLASFRTVEKAMEGWPEAADIIADVVGDPRPANLPALTTLNAALDLPPEEKEAT